MDFLHFDKYTLTHSIRVAMLSKAFGQYCGFEEDEIDFLLIGGLLHDIGKFLIPIDVLNKPNINIEEFDLIKQHPELGYALLQNHSGKCSFLSPEILSIVHEHHEKLDGTGYPFSLNYSDIHVLSQVVTICDIFDALVTRRPYKIAFSVSEAFSIMDDEVYKGHIDNTLYEKFKGFISTELSPTELIYNF